MTSLIFFSFILLFGTITSYEDIRWGRIRNKYILSALLFTALINSLMFLGVIEDHNLDEGYYLALLINVIIAFGDAKLFSAYAALVPLTTYRQGYTQYFPSFTLLSNTQYRIYSEGSSL